MSTKYRHSGLPFLLSGVSRLLEKMNKQLISCLPPTFLFLCLVSYFTAIPTQGLGRKRKTVQMAAFPVPFIISPLVSQSRNYVRAAAAVLPGNWTGTMACDDGDTLTLDFKVTPNGNPVYQYQTREGNHRQVELTHAGQIIKFLPPQGGVTQVGVVSLAGSAKHLSYSLDISNERVEGGNTLVQVQTSLAAKAILSGEVLDLEFTISSRSFTSQPDFMVPGDPQEGICHGKLRKKK